MNRRSFLQAVGACALASTAQAQQPRFQVIGGYQRVPAEILKRRNGADLTFAGFAISGKPTKTPPGIAGRNPNLNPQGFVYVPVRFEVRNVGNAPTGTRFEILPIYRYWGQQARRAGFVHARWTLRLPDGSGSNQGVGGFAPGGTLLQNQSMPPRSILQCWSSWIALPSIENKVADLWLMLDSTSNVKELNERNNQTRQRRVNLP